MGKGTAKKSHTTFTKLWSRYPRLVRFVTVTARVLALIIFSYLTFAVVTAMLDNFYAYGFLYSSLGALTIVALIKSLNGTLKSTVLNFWVWGMSALCVVILLAAAGLMLSGLVMDAMGVVCAGFFGSPEGCVINQLWWLVLLAVLPGTFPIVWFIALAVLAKGWYDELSLSHKSRKLAK